MQTNLTILHEKQRKGAKIVKLKVVTQGALV